MSKMQIADREREDAVKQMIVQTLQAARKRLGKRKVVLFGSRARNQHRPASDFDIGVVGNEPLPLADFYALEDMFDELPTLYRIDWVDFARASERFRERGLTDVEVLYE